MTDSLTNYSILQEIHALAPRGEADGEGGGEEEGDGEVRGEEEEEGEEVEEEGRKGE